MGDGFNFPNKRINTIRFIGASKKFLKKVEPSSLFISSKRTMISGSRALLRGLAAASVSSLAPQAQKLPPSSLLRFSKQNFSTLPSSSSPLFKRQHSPLSLFPSSSFHGLRYVSSHQQSMEQNLASACPKTNSILPSFDTVSGAEATEDGPVVVILHGILGSRRNWKSFSKLYLQLNPTHRILLVDLRNHGGSSIPSPSSSSSSSSSSSPFPITQNGVENLAMDIVRLEDEWGGGGFDVVVGHSFGGKVAYSYSQMRNKTNSQQVWALDTWLEDHFEDTKRNEEAVDKILDFIKNNPHFESRKDLLTRFSQTGLTSALGQWLSTSLTWVDDDDRGQGMCWVYNIDNIFEMYESYKVTNVWEKVVTSPHPHTHYHLVRAGKSTRWTPPVIEKLENYSQTPGKNFSVHVMENAGHWVHVDDPDDLLSILHEETMYL